MPVRRVPPKPPTSAAVADKTPLARSKKVASQAIDEKPAVKALRALFGRNLAQARQDAGLSQRALSRLTGISQRHISAIELGTVNPSLATIVELAMSVGQSPIELLRPAS
jgi:putative transcriptional regulator